MAKAEINVNVITITEEELRRIIREEVQKVVEPGAVRPPYIPPYVPRMPNLPYIGDIPTPTPIWCQTVGTTIPEPPQPSYSKQERL